MGLDGFILNGLSAALSLILNMVQLLVLASIIISWLGAPTSNPIVSMVNAVTEPLYRPFRGIARKIPGPFDWTPMIILILVVFLQKSIVPWLRTLAL